MNKVEFDPWDDIQLSPEDSIQTHNENQEKDPWDEIEFQEGFWKNAFRTALQVPQGIAEATKSGIATGLWHLIGSGEVFDPEEVERIRNISEREGIPFDEDAYYEAAQNAAASIPTVSNIASAIESRTGIPLEPKQWYQKGLRLGSSAYKFQGGPASQRAAAGITAPVASEALQQAGVPEPLAELGGLGIGNVVGGKTPGVNLTKTKPSGMPERGFERLKEPTEVPAKKIQQINDKLETDFKTISDEIIKDSPIGETAENLKNDPRFKRESKELLDQAQILANETPGTIPSMNYKQNLLKQSQNQMKGFTLNEYKKNYLKFMKEAVENVIPENVTHGELVEQYRENNRSLGEYFEPGASKALNRAKKDVLLDQNRAIASTLEESNPELSKVFKEGNERWTKIMDAETVDNFVSDMFPEGKKVDFKHMKSIFDDPNYQRIFKRALGEEGAKGFEGAVEDMLTAERPYKMMREAQDKGFGDMLLTAKAYLFNPKLGYAKAGFDALRFGYRSLFNATLDKPRIGLNFTKAVNELKQGNFKAAERDFKEVQAEVMPKEKPKEIARQEETIEATPEKTEPKQIEQKAKPEEPKEPEIAKKKGKSEEKQTNKSLKEEKLTLDDLKKELKSLEKTAQESFRTPTEKAKENVARKRELRKKIQEFEKPASSLTENKVKEIKRNDISKQGLKTQKAYLLENIQKAIDKPPKGDKVTFDVPGDGIFKINNNETALKKFAENIEKRWPDKPYRPGRKKQIPEIKEHHTKEYELAREKEFQEHLERERQDLKRKRPQSPKRQ